MEPTTETVPLVAAVATQAFRRESWRSLQLALDPLGSPRPLPAPVVLTHP
jgi:hypothetical protein